MKVKRVCIVGGGTGGLITALMLKHGHPYLDIDLIESKSIGIIGVGEGSTEHWMKFMRNCDISLHELVSETGATFKYGINFANWNGDGRSYFQSVNGEFNLTGPVGGVKYVYANLISKNIDPLFLVKSYVIKSELLENNYNINQFHFDTFKLNEFLHKKCFKSGIRLIEAEINQVKLTPDGAIDSIVSADGRTFEYDFFIDSTGFAKLLMTAMEVPWISYSKYLPMNSAIAFPTERLEDIPAWTLARAMNAGWSWRIPTQERFGNGYVFSDKFLDFEGAQREMEELYGHSIDIGKKIKFDAGCLEKSWHKNCAAIGLSSSFIEPLEASSIGTSIQQAILLCETLPYYVPENDKAERTFNKHSDAILQNILDFVALHYITKRDDTEFWRSVKDLPKPPSLEEMLDIYQHKFPADLDFENKRVLFQGANWIIVMHGLGLLNSDIAKKEIEKLPELMKNHIDVHMPPSSYLPSMKWISHRQAINNILGI
jgi:hypothetical protein